ncbi:MAG: acetyl-CoA carboxylase carboxyltransferase subunit alpha [Clostridia bacterium]|nr:acetyl-CoA carboxylase carboxyltransferase subunit alpha [Clostridia bacterium]
MSKQQTSEWDRVLIARSPDRPRTTDYIENIFDDFIELHGDRLFGDDKAILGGIAKIGGKIVTIIGEQKGKTTKENMERNFGMPNPEGYRKALRLMKQAEKFKRPIITFIDTPGAYPGIGAEERGQGEAIAKNLLEMSRLKVPIICVVIGEGSSGGALAIGVGDKVLMLENSIYSILSPEGFASILYKDSTQFEKAAKEMKITAKDLKDLGVVDEIIKENDIFENVKKSIVKNLQLLEKKTQDNLIKDRYEKYRIIGSNL